MEQKKIAERFHPGEFIKEELEERDWSQIELSEILGRDKRLVNELVLGKRSITPETAKALAEAFGTSAELWMNLESAYQLGRSKSADNVISRRSRLYQLAPIKEMVKRHWIEWSDNIDVLETSVMSYFGASTLKKPFAFKHASRKSAKETNPSHIAWVNKAKQLARAVSVKRYSERSFNECLNKLKALTNDVNEVRRIPKILADAGIRLVIIEHLPKTKIDGATLWLDVKSPVIALSLRYDRIDNFWHTLMHELRHVKNKDGLDNPIIDIDIMGNKEEKSVYEKRIDLWASHTLIDKDELKDFIIRVGPLYGTKKIINFAKRIKVHPGIVVGQLHNKEEIHWSKQRRMLVKIRDLITQAALTDGWGEGSPPV